MRVTKNRTYLHLAIGIGTFRRLGICHGSRNNATKGVWRFYACLCSMN